MTSITAGAPGAPVGSLTPSPQRVLAIAPALVVAAFASIGAGAIHAAAIGVHSEHRQAVITFSLVATAQIGWGVLALVFRSRWFVLLGALVNAAIVGGWVLAKTSGISFIDGMEASEGAQLADTLAVGLATAAVVGALAALATHLRPSPIGHTTLGAIALVTALLAVPGMVSAGSHAHAGGHGGGAAGHGTTGGESGGDHGQSSSVPPVPYDPTKPLDLGGVEGVSLEQQARAENLIAVTLLRLPRFADPAVAEAEGFQSIGDGATGEEHYINVAYFDDGRILDPDYPESLVYQPQPDGTKKLAAAMFMLEPDKTLEDVPDVGGKLTQWHIHNNLCFTSSGRVAGISTEPGKCSPGLNPGTQAPMIHVWIQPHPCGPFAALEGIGGGQIRAGETKLCDQAHGHGA